MDKKNLTNIFYENITIILKCFCYMLGSNNTGMKT